MESEVYVSGGVQLLTMSSNTIVLIALDKIQMLVTSTKGFWKQSFAFDYVIKHCIAAVARLEELEVISQKIVDNPYAAFLVKAAVNAAARLEIISRKIVYNPYAALAVISFIFQILLLKKAFGNKAHQTLLFLSPLTKSR